MRTEDGWLGAITFKQLHIKPKCESETAWFTACIFIGLVREGADLYLSVLYLADDLEKLVITVWTLLDDLKCTYKNVVEKEGENGMWGDGI